MLSLQYRHEVRIRYSTLAHKTTWAGAVRHGYQASFNRLGRYTLSLWTSTISREAHTDSTQVGQLSGLLYGVLFQRVIPQTEEMRCHGTIAVIDTAVLLPLRQCRERVQRSLCIATGLFAVFGGSTSRNEPPSTSTITSPILAKAETRQVWHCSKAFNEVFSSLIRSRSILRGSPCRRFHFVFVCRREGVDWSNVRIGHEHVKRRRRTFPFGWGNGRMQSSISYRVIPGIRLGS